MSVCVRTCVRVWLCVCGQAGGARLEGVDAELVAGASVTDEDVAEQLRAGGQH